MPLSEHEQRLFDQIERSLAEDPKFASAVRASDPRFHTRRRLLVAGAVTACLRPDEPASVTAFDARGD